MVISTGSRLILLCLYHQPDWCRATGFTLHKYKYTNTNTQIHKYSVWQNDRNTQHMLYFWTAGGSRMSKMIFWTVRYTNTQIQIHKYTNTQIQHMTKWPKYPTYAIFLNSWWFKDVKNDNPEYSDPWYTVDFCTVPPGLFYLVSVWKSGEMKMKFGFCTKSRSWVSIRFVSVWKSVKKITRKRLAQYKEVFIWYQCESLQKIKWNLFLHKITKLGQYSLCFQFESL